MLADKPRSLILITLLQIVPVAVLPLGSYADVNVPIVIIVVVLFALLGMSLLRGRRWARSATIFVQGMNIIVRLLMSLSHAVEGTELGAPVSVSFLATALVSMALSALILYVIDQPEIEMAMQ